MNKFIVTSEGLFKFGDVSLHKHLLSPGESCIGGGMYEWDLTGPRLLLSGRSYDFGRVKWDFIDTLLLPSSLRGVEILYETIPLSAFADIKYLE